MAYENHNAAYDLSLFDEELTYSSAAPKRKQEEQPARKSKRKQKSKVVQLPEQELNKIRRRRHNPVKIAVGTLSAAIVTFVIGIIIVGQVQLTELNQDIITAQATLADTESIYTQNQMKVEANLSNAEIEKYATETLGMTKASNAQKEFVAIEEGDKAEVSAADNGNIFTRFFESIFNLWS
jgi:hypothetical protein